MFTRLLERELPSLMPHAAGPELFVRDPSWAAGYAAGVYFGEEQERSVLGLTIYASLEQPEQAVAHGPCPPANAQCTRDTVLGTVVTVLREQSPAGWQLNAYRADGTGVILVARATAPGDQPPFTEAQLIAIVAAPELTLYP